jgi:hypothetical protein
MIVTTLFFSIKKINDKKQQILKTNKEKKFIYATNQNNQPTCLRVILTLNSDFYEFVLLVE